MPFITCVITITCPQRGNMAKDQPNSLDSQPGRTVVRWPKALSVACATTSGAKLADMKAIILADKPLDYSDIAQHLKTLRAVGTPYTDEMIANAKADLEAQVDPDRDPTALEKRYPRVVVGKFNGNTSSITEMDALVSYLQMLGTLVHFGDLPPERLRQ